MTSYFDVKQRIQPPKPPVKEAETIIMHPPPPPLASSTVAAPATSSLLELVMLNMLQAQTQQQAHFSAFSYPYLPGSGVQPSSPIAVPVQTASPAPTSPNPKPVHRQITLDEFCAHYSIASADRERLDKLEYCPGDALEKLDREDWQGQAGFSKLAWCRMLDVHRALMRDVKQGVWL